MCCAIISIRVGSDLKFKLDATSSTRVAHKNKIDLRGLMRLYGLPTCALNTSLLTPAAQTVKLVSVSRNCAFYCTPKFITAASGFGGICHYTVVIEHVCNMLKVLS